MAESAGWDLRSGKIDAHFLGDRLETQIKCPQRNPAKYRRREDVRVRASTEAATTLFAQFKTFCIDGVRTERPMSVQVSTSPVLETTNSGFVGYTLRQADDGLPVEEFTFYIE